MILTTNARIEIATDSPLSDKTRHLLRQRLEEVIEDVVDSTLAEFDIDNQFVRAVCLDEIDVEEGDLNG